MPEPLYVLVNFVIIFIRVVTFAMMLRAITSFFMIDENKFTRFLYVFTEPMIMPVRKILVKKNWLQNSPLDFSFLITYLVLFIVEIFLSSYIQ